MIVRDTTTTQESAKAAPVSIEKLDWDTIVREIKILDSKMKPLKDRREKLAKMLKSWCEEVQIDHIEDDHGFDLFTYFPQCRESIDTKKLKTEAPEVFEKYKKETYTRTLLIK